MTKPIALCLALAGLMSATEARAQHVIRGRHASPIAAYSPLTPGVAATTAAPASAVRTYPYSYYVAYPHPARGYVGYGEQDQFPYYGRPYGHPYDPWTWPYMSGGYNGALARYYDPPVK